MSGGVEMALTGDRVEQARGEKVNVKQRVEQATNEGYAEDRGNEQTRDEASVSRSEDVVDCIGLKTSVAIICYYWPSTTLASTLKRLSDKIQITLTLSSLDGLTEDEKRILQSTEILLVQPTAIENSSLINNLPKLKWMHSLNAGVEQLMQANEPQKRPPPTYILTRNVGCFDRPMADFVITMIIARERHFRDFWENQTKKLWMVKMARPLSEVSIGIVGFGRVGKEVARVSKFFGLTVWALVRSLPSESTKCPEVDEYRLVSDLGDLLSSCDYIVNILPSTPSTDGIFDGDTLSKGKTKKPVFMNIGRANVISDSTIIHALNEGWISHAIIDVFEQEPLPSDSPLWSHPEVTATTHNSAHWFNYEEFLKSFLDDYDRYINGKPLLHTVDWKKGY